MAKALVEVIGDSASAVRALEQTSAAFTATGDAAATAAGEVDAFAASMAKAQAARAETLLAQAGALKTYAASNDATALEASAARARAAQNETRAQRLLGIQTAQTASVTRTAGSVGRGLTTYVTAPAAFVGYEAVKQAIDFNQQMLLLKTQAGDATDSIKQLSDQVLKLAGSGAPQGPGQLAEGLFHLVSLGLRGAQAMGTLREASLAAGMGMANLEDTSTALGAAVVSGIKGAQNYQQAMATLVGTAGAGNMRFQDLASSIGNVIPSAAAAGVTLHEMGAALAVLTDRGMTADEASTRLRMSLSLIQRPSKAAQAALADMGVNADQLGAIVRQPNGLLHVLEILHTAIDKVGAVRGNRDLLAAFGGARSGIGIQTLVQSLDSSVSSYQGKLQQINQDQAQFAQNQQAYLESPAYKLHAALSQVEADLVKLGTSLTPAVTGMAGAISALADGFSALPGPIKESLGIAVGLLAVGGPLALGIAGIGRLLGALGGAFRMLGLSAERGVAGADAALTGLKGETAGAEAKVATLRASLAGLAAKAFVVTLILDMIPKSSAGQGALDQSGLGFLGHLPVLGGLDTQVANFANKYIRPALGESPLGQPRNGRAPKPPRGYVAGTYGMGASTHDNPAGYLTPAEMRKLGYDPNSYGQGASTRQDPAGFLRLGTAADKRFEASHHQRHLPDAYTARPDVTGTTAAAAAAKAKQQQTAFDQAIHNDQLLAQARIDLANGETVAAQRLLKQDEARLQLMLSEAKTATERTDVLRQLAEVERLRHSKRSDFALSPRLQEEMAKADAQAALEGNLQGPTSRQLALARQAKAAAMRAINSHLLTLQGLTQAWQIVGQENAIIAQARGAIDTYHAVSSKAIVDSVKGLTQTQRLQLRERIAQEEAHRGYAPNRPGAQHHYHHVHVTVQSNDSHIVKVVKKHDRQSHQRAGGRR